MSRIAQKDVRGGSSPVAHAVVAGIDLNGLGVLRSLGRAGVPMVALDPDLNKPEAATRFGRKKRLRALSGPEFVADLLALRSEFDAAPVLLLTQEASVATVSRARDRLSGAYRFTMPSHALVAALMDKRCFQALAERHGCPIPRAVLLSDAASLDMVETLRFPCVVKPTIKHAGYGTRFAKAYKVSAPDQVARLFSHMREIVAEIIVQEWIEGSDFWTFISVCNTVPPMAAAACPSSAGRPVNGRSRLAARRAVFRHPRPTQRSWR